MGRNNIFKQRLIKIVEGKYFAITGQFTEEFKAQQSNPGDTFTWVMMYATWDRYTYDYLVDLFEGNETE